MSYSRIHPALGWLLSYPALRSLQARHPISQYQNFKLPNRVPNNRIKSLITKSFGYVHQPLKPGQAGGIWKLFPDIKISREKCLGTSVFHTRSLTLDRFGSPNTPIHLLIHHLTQPTPDLIPNFRLRPNNLLKPIRAPIANLNRLS